MGKPLTPKDRIGAALLAAVVLASVTLSLCLRRCSDRQNPACMPRTEIISPEEAPHTEKARVEKGPTGKKTGHKSRRKAPAKIKKIPPRDFLNDTLRSE